MTVDIRQTGAQWLLEVRGASLEWQTARLKRKSGRLLGSTYEVARLLARPSPEPQGQLPECLTGLLVTKSEG